MNEMTLLLLFVWFSLTNALDHIVMNGPKLSVEVRTASSNTIINGFSNNYIKLDNHQDELLTITCSKVNRILTGTLFAFVNSNTAIRTSCLELAFSFSVFKI
jgi:hypothetical protein